MQIDLDTKKAVKMVQTFHLVYSTVGWPFEQYGPSYKKDFLKMSLKEKRKFKRAQDGVYECSDTTLPYFRELLAKEAKEQGFKVVRHPFRNKEGFLKIGEMARSGQMAPGSVAVLCHSWFRKVYKLECVPSWDFYPVINALRANHDMIYPHPELDQLHSEKRYTSSLMAPTRYVTFVRRDDGWKVRGHGNKDVSRVVVEELRTLKGKAKAKDLKFEDLMVKQGLSWGGESVKRLRPSDVPEYITEKILPSIPEEAGEITVLLQAKLDIVSELRWCMVDGELKGNMWKAANEPKMGQLASSAGYQQKGRKLVERFVKQHGKFTIDELETKMGVLSRKVYAEAAADAGGKNPLYMRIDLLLDRQGRVWLGERESWGADLKMADSCKGMDPTFATMAKTMISKTKLSLRGMGKGKHVPKSKTVGLKVRSKFVKKSIASPMGRRSIKA